MALNMVTAAGLLEALENLSVRLENFYRNAHSATNGEKGTQVNQIFVQLS